MKANIQTMTKEKYNEIIDEVYQNYLKTHKDETFIMLDEMDLSKEEFIEKAKNNYGFGFLFGITLNEHELSLEERVAIWDEKFLKDVKPEEMMNNLDLDGDNIPTKKITLEYNNEKFEIYE